MTRPPSWVLDTNVIVSGLLGSGSSPGRLVDMVLARQLRLTCDDRIWQEYRDVLSRPRFKIPSDRLQAFLATFMAQDQVVARPLPGPASPDPDDQMFLEVAHASTDRTLVTGNGRNFPVACRQGVRVLTPRDAWTHFQEPSR